MLILTVLFYTNKCSYVSTLVVRLSWYIYIALPSTTNPTLLHKTGLPPLGRLVNPQKERAPGHSFTLVPFRPTEMRTPLKCFASRTWNRHALATSSITPTFLRHANVTRTSVDSSTSLITFTWKNYFSLDEVQITPHHGVIPHRAVLHK